MLVDSVRWDQQFYEKGEADPIQIINSDIKTGVQIATLRRYTLHDFAHKQDSQLNSSALITVWRVVI